MPQPEARRELHWLHGVGLAMSESQVRRARMRGEAEQALGRRQR